MTTTKTKVMVLKDNGQRKLSYDPARHEAWIRKYTTLSDMSVNKILDMSQQRPEVDADTLFQNVIDVLNEETDPETPHYQFEATKVFMRRMYKRVSRLRSYDSEEKYGDFYGLLKKYGSLGYYHQNLLKKYSKEDIKRIGDMIVPERDELFTYIGIHTLEERYLAKTGDNVTFELPQERWMVIAMWLMQDEQPNEERLKKIEEAYWAMSNLYMTVATPTLANSGKTHAQLSSCFPPETQIATRNGDKAIKDIEIGDEVLTHDGSFKSVTELHVRDNVDKKLIEFRLSGHPALLRATPEHPFLVLVDTKKKKDRERVIEELNDGVTKNLRWVAAKDIKQKDYVVVGSEFLDMSKGKTEIYPAEYIKNADLIEHEGYLHEKISETSSNFINRGKTINTQTQPVPKVFKLDHDFGKVLGLYLADGYVGKNKRNLPSEVVLTLGTKRDAKAIIFLKEWAQRVLGYTPSINDNPNDNSTKLVLGGKLLAEVIHALFGETYATKRLPLDQQVYNKEFLTGLMQGAFLGDGTVTRRGVKLQLTNPELVKQMYNVMLNLDLYPAYRETMTSSGKMAGILELSVTTEKEREFALGASHNNEKLANNLNNVNFKLAYINSKVQGYNLRRVSEVRETPHDDKVYNLDVEENHTYVADGIVVHNCFISTISDSLENIYDGIADMAELSKSGGGIGVVVSKIRPRGSSIKGFKGASGGIVPWIKNFNEMAVAVDQLGK